MLAALTEIVQAFARTNQPESALGMAAEVNDSAMRAAVVTEIVNCFEVGRSVDTVLQMAPRTRSRLWPLLARSLARAGHTREAFLAAGEIDDKPARGTTLADMAVLLLQSQRAADTVEAAMKALDDLVEPQYGDEQFLRSMVQTLVRTGNAKAAIEQLRQLRSERLRTELMLAVARELGTAGRAGEAIEACEQTDGSVRSRAYTETATALAEAGHTEEAQSVASHVSDPQMQQELQAVFARCWAALGKTGEALQACDRIPGGAEKGRVLSAVARLLGEHRQNEDAYRVAWRAFEELNQNAVKNVRELQEPILVLAKTARAEEVAALVVRAVAPALRAPASDGLRSRNGSSGPHDQAFQLAEQAAEPELRMAIISEAEGLVSPVQDVAIAIRFASRQSVYSRPRRLAEIARDLAGLGNAKDAGTAADAALQALRQIDAKEERAVVARDVAYLLAEAAQFDQTLAAARESMARHGRESIERLAVALSRRGLVTEAFKATHEIRNPEAQQRIFATMAVTFAGLGHREGALAAVREIRDKEVQPELLADVAQALARAGAIDDGRRIAERIADPYTSARALVAISGAYADAGDSQQAHGAAYAAWSAAGKIAAFDQYSNLLVSISGAYARIKAYPDAVLALEGCERASDRLAAACAILYWDSFHRHPELATYIRSTVSGTLSSGDGEGKAGKRFATTWLVPGTSDTLK